ncbi:E3 ubiquitin-protein ligase MARCHF2-like [Dermacentor albipictus]|uniref:E3 ubiquitin-protein ligase MARCHF2-like n=1 Tax=Dermacentor albipictus TaxID=60249 RepID=UPI0031FE0B22
MAAAIVPAAPDEHGDGFCRFCAGDSSSEPLVTPCNCEGTISTSHKSCLEKRILQNGVTRCYLCNYKYEYKVKTKPVVMWLVSEEHRRDVFQLLSMLTQYLCDTIIIVIAVVKGVEMVIQAPLVMGMLTAFCCGSCALLWITLLFMDLWAFYLPLRRWLRDNMTVVLTVPAKPFDSRAPESCHSTDELRGE